jgi:lambda family phage portal protein
LSLIDDLKQTADRVVGAFAPVHQARRQMARTAMNLAGRFSSAYDGAKKSRSFHNRPTSGGSPDADLDGDTLAELRERSRDRVRNDPVARSMTNSMVTYLVGNGFRPKLRLNHEELGISKEHAKRLTQQAKGIYEDFCRHSDAGNRQTFAQQQALVVAQVLMNGDVFVRPLMIQDRRVRSRFELKLDIIEGDQVDTPIGLVKPNLHIGVEFGKRHQPIGYWVADDHPGSDGLGGRTAPRKFRRIAAHAPTGRPNILHVYNVERPKQKRGVPILAPVLDKLKDRGDLNEAVLVAAQVGACFAAFIKSNDPWGSLDANTTTDTKGTDQPEEELSPGTITRLGLNEDVTFANPNQPLAALEPFLRSITREITAGGVDLPYEIAMGDFTGLNYSGARAAFLHAFKTFSTRHTWLVPGFCQPVWQMVLEEAWLKGDFDALDFSDRPEAWTRTHWQPPGQGWVDPQKEVMAWEKGLELGITTRQAIISTTSGEDFEDITEQIAEENEIREKAGLASVLPSDDDSDSGTPPAEPDDDEDENDTDEESEETADQEAEEATANS